MGNQISDTSNHAVINLLNTNTILGKQLLKWALNNYKIHPDATDDFYGKDILKKRACCTQNPNPFIGFIGVDSTGNNLSNYTIKIPVTGTINQAFCTNLAGTKSTDNFNNPGNQKSPGYYGNELCTSFYSVPGSSSSDSFCSYVLRNRSNADSSIREDNNGNMLPPPNPAYLYNNPASNQIYGLNSDRSSSSLINPYPDCNCTNSLFEIYPNYFSTDNTRDPVGMALNLDSRCSTSLDNNGSGFIKSYQTDSLNCIGIIKINDSIIDIAKGGTLAINNVCNIKDITTTPSSTTQTTPSTPQTTPSTPQTTPSTPQTTPSTPQTPQTTTQKTQSLTTLLTINNLIIVGAIFLLCICFCVMFIFVAVS